MNHLSYTSLKETDIDDQNILYEWKPFFQTKKEQNKVFKEIDNY